MDDPDFVHLKRFDYSLAKVMERYPDGAPDRLIAQALMLTEDDVTALYERVLIKLRRAMHITDDIL